MAALSEGPLASGGTQARPVSPLARWLPGAFFLAYLIGTVLLFYFGPWQYPVSHQGRLLAFLIAAHTALALGYVHGLRATPRASRWPVRPRTLALLAIGVDLALLPPASHYYTGHWIPPFWDALRDLDQAYSEQFRRQLAGGAYVNYVRMLIAPALASSLPLGIFYWRSLGRWGRAALVVLVVGTLALFVAMGTNKGLGEWAMVYPWFVLAGHLSGTLRLNRRAAVAAAAIGAASFALFFPFFGATMYARSGSAARLGRLDSTGAVFKAPPDGEGRSTAVDDPVAAAVAGFTSYLTQGYRAVDLSLGEPFVPMWGIGHSLFLQRQAVRLTGDPAILERSYPERIEAQGWHAARSWATIYPWIASDVGFPGAVAVVYLIGCLLAVLWTDAIGARNPFAVAALGQVLLMLYYFPAHNRCLQTGEGVVAFWGLLLFWWLSRRRS